MQVSKEHLDLIVWQRMNDHPAETQPTPAIEAAEFDDINFVTAEFLNALVDTVCEDGARVKIEGFGWFSPVQMRDGRVWISFTPSSDLIVRPRRVSDD